MLNKVGLISSSWILTSAENCIEIDLVILNLHFVLDNITTNFKKCQFATAHIASRAGNMYCEWIGSCYVHKSLPLELLGLRCIFDEPGNIYLPMRHIFKLVEHFGSVGQSDWSEPVRSWVRFSQSGILAKAPDCFNFALFATCAQLGAWARWASFTKESWQTLH